MKNSGDVFTLLHPTKELSLNHSSLARELILLSNKKSILLEKWRMRATPLRSTSHTISYALRAIKTYDVFMRDQYKSFSIQNMALKKHKSL